MFYWCLPSALSCGINQFKLRSLWFSQIIQGIYKIRVSAQWVYLFCCFVAIPFFSLLLTLSPHSSSCCSELWFSWQTLCIFLCICLSSATLCSSSSAIFLFISSLLSSMIAACQYWHVLLLNTCQYFHNVLACIVVSSVLCIGDMYWIDTSMYSILTCMHSIHTALQAEYRHQYIHQYYPNTIKYRPIQALI